MTGLKNVCESMGKCLKEVNNHWDHASVGGLNGVVIKCKYILNEQKSLKVKKSADRTQSEKHCIIKYLIICFIAFHFDYIE